MNSTSALNMGRNQIYRLLKYIGARNSAHVLAIAIEHRWIQIGEIDGNMPIKERLFESESDKKGGDR